MDIVVYVYLHMYLHLIAVTRSDICLSFIGSSVMEGKLKFVVHGRKEGNKFVLEEISNYILKSLESFNGKTIIVTFEIPVTTNEINMNNCILIN